MHFGYSECSEKMERNEARFVIEINEKWSGKLCQLELDWRLKSRQSKLSSGLRAHLLPPEKTDRYKHITSVPKNMLWSNNKRHVALKGFKKKRRSIRKWYLCRCYCISPFAFLFYILKFFYLLLPSASTSYKRNDRRRNNEKSKEEKIVGEVCGFVTAGSLLHPDKS